MNFLKEVLEILICMYTGLTGGISIGLGLWPKYEQPRNIRIQTVLGIASAFGFGLLFIYTGIFK